MKSMEIRKLVVGYVSTNCYIVWDKATKEAIIIDPGDEAKRIQNVIKEEELSPKAILLTHGHFDHIMAVKDISETYDISICCHEKEVELFKDGTLNLAGRLGEKKEGFTPKVQFKDGEEAEFAHLKFKVLYTPGHTQGGACYYFYEEKCVFAGDTLFFESVGRTDFPTGDTQTLLQSIHDKLYVLDDDVEVYPGHGAATSIGYEKENNPFTSSKEFWD